jgi:D-glycero-alpha-D-manno-heptose 1-phosphate guanylyltransferase
MEAIVLAGGFGTRLRALVPDTPKPMAPVAGKPFLEILLHALSQKGFDRVVLSLGFLADKVTEHFGTRFAGMDLHYVIEDHPLGTGGAVRLALASCLQDHVFVFNGDTFLDIEADALEASWQADKHPIIVSRQVPDTTRYGRLLTEAGRVTGFEEKGSSGPGLINAGCYVFARDQLDSFALNQNFSLETDHLSNSISKTHFNFFVTQGLFIDIGVPEDYLRAQNIFTFSEKYQSS